MMRTGPTDKIFEQSLEVGECGKGVPARGAVGIKARRQGLAWCSKKKKEGSGTEAE